MLEGSADDPKNSVGFGRCDGDMLLDRRLAHPGLFQCYSLVGGDGVVLRIYHEIYALRLHDICML